ncbi:MAG: hypothetical protein UEL03_08470 [Clostridium sp.]|uniref:zinc ribbon domain-containing protein n=1 Tax=Clostridium sp. TaxID=1506 RepID=UPI002E78303D|nr:hypothetical protein [Clostridium sp.]MEE0131404.1 hypothetical protein [Clostridium sp.]
MICPKCGREQIKPSKFCTYCGAQMDMNGMENQSFNETNDTSEKHSSHRTASHTVHKAASTAAKAGAVGLTTKIAIGAAGVCLAAGVGAVGLHMGHNWGAGKAVVAEKESGENDAETSEEKFAENADESSDEAVNTSAESNETQNVDEINREAVAAYRKYVLEKRELPIENGGMLEFSVIDVNGDGIFEMEVNNLNMEEATPIYYAATFLWYVNGKLHEMPLMPFTSYDFNSGKIGAWESHMGAISLTIYQFDGKQVSTLGTWEASDSTKANTSSEIRQLMKEIDSTVGMNQTMCPSPVDINPENADKYLSNIGMASSLEKDQSSFSNLFQYTLEEVESYEREEAKEAQKAAFIAPYKAQLDTILAGTFEYSEDCVGTYSMNVKDAYESNIGIGVSWDGIEDKGDYYIIKNAELYYTPESASFGHIATLQELYVRKDGSYQYHDGYNRNSVTLQEFLSKYPYSEARWGVKFDEQGFIVSWWDGNVA